METYGTVGGSLRGKGQGWGRGKVKAGAAGERATSALLDRMFGSDFDVYLFNDVSVPGLDRANADHVVVRGRRVLVVDSKRWAPGFYWRWGGCRRGRQRFVEGDKTEVTAIAVANLGDWLTARLGYRPSVSGLVVVHPNPGNPGRYRTWALRLPGGLALRVGERAEALILERLGRRAQPDAALLEALHSLVRP